MQSSQQGQPPVGGVGIFGPMPGPSAPCPGAAGVMFCGSRYWLSNARVGAADRVVSVPGAAGGAVLSQQRFRAVRGQVRQTEGPGRPGRSGTRTLPTRDGGVEAGGQGRWMISSGAGSAARPPAQLRGDPGQEARPMSVAVQAFSSTPSRCTNKADTVHCPAPPATANPPTHGLGRDQPGGGGGCVGRIEPVELFGADRDVDPGRWRDPGRWLAELSAGMRPRAPWTMACTPFQASTRATARQFPVSAWAESWSVRASRWFWGANSWAASERVGTRRRGGRGPADHANQVLTQQLEPRLSLRRQKFERHRRGQRRAGIGIRRSESPGFRGAGAADSAAALFANSKRRTRDEDAEAATVTPMCQDLRCVGPWRGQNTLATP